MYFYSAAMNPTTPTYAFQPGDPKIVDFSNEQYTDPQCPIHKIKQDKVIEVPYEHFYVHFFKILSIPYDSVSGPDLFDRLNCAIEKILQSIECLVVNFDPCCCRWRLCYGTRTIEQMLTHDQKHIFHKKNQVLLDMLMEIYRKQDEPLTQLTEENDPLGERYLDIIPKREWCIAEIIISRKIGEDGNETLECYYNRICGSRTSAMFMFCELRNRIGDLLHSNSSDRIVESRMDILKLMEGISPEAFTGSESRICNYLLNDIMVREICSFIPYRKFMN